AHGEPTRDQEAIDQVQDHLPRPGGEEVVDAAEGAGDHRRILPIRYPTRNASPTIAAKTKAAKAKTISLSPTFAIVRSHPWPARPGGKGTPSREPADPRHGRAREPQPSPRSARP